MTKAALCIGVGVDDWTVERAIIATNVVPVDAVLCFRSPGGAGGGCGTLGLAPRALYRLVGMRGRPPVPLRFLSSFS